MSLVESRIQDRKDAEEIMDFIGERLERFWEKLAEMVKGKLPQEQKPEQLVPMNDAQAMIFENQVVEYGKYVGCQIRDVPTEYLAWLCDGNDFTKKLKRYLASQRFKTRQDTE